MANSYYLQPDGVSKYLMPDGVSFYIIDTGGAAANPLKIVGAPFAFVGQVGLVGTPNA